MTDEKQKLTSKSTPKSIPKPKSKPTPKSAPKSTPKITPKAIPKATSKATPKSTSKPTPKSSSVPVESWSMYPSHHDAVSNLLKEHALSFGFHEDDDSDCEEEYDTNIMGRFRCNNRGCPTRGWSSKVVAITIRMYDGDEYNARVYHQRCRACDGLSKPELGESYAERVAYRLKRWHGVEMEIPRYSRESKAPHKSDLCEGCKNGHCKAGEVW